MKSTPCVRTQAIEAVELLRFARRVLLRIWTAGMCASRGWMQLGHGTSAEDVSLDWLRLKVSSTRGHESLLLRCHGQHRLCFLSELERGEPRRERLLQKLRVARLEALPALGKASAVCQQPCPHLAAWCLLDSEVLGTVEQVRSKQPENLALMGQSSPQMFCESDKRLCCRLSQASWHQGKKLVGSLT